MLLWILRRYWFCEVFFSLTTFCFWSTALVGCCCCCYFRYNYLFRIAAAHGFPCTLNCFYVYVATVYQSHNVSHMVFKSLIEWNNDLTTCHFILKQTQQKKKLRHTFWCRRKGKVNGITRNQAIFRWNAIWGAYCGTCCPWSFHVWRGESKILSTFRSFIQYGLRFSSSISTIDNSVPCSLQANFLQIDFVCFINITRMTGDKMKYYVVHASNMIDHCSCTWRCPK